MVAEEMAGKMALGLVVVGMEAVKVAAAREVMMGVMTVGLVAQEVGTAVGAMEVVWVVARVAAEMAVVLVEAKAVGEKVVEAVAEAEMVVAQSTREDA